MAEIEAKVKAIIAEKLGVEELQTKLISKLIWAQTRWTL